MRLRFWRVAEAEAGVENVRDPAHASSVPQYARAARSAVSPAPAVRVRPRGGRAGSGHMTAPMSRPEALAALTAPGEPYELEVLEIDGRTVRSFKNGPASLRAMYELCLSDLPFIVYEDERYTFAEAWRAASRIGHLLVHECGIGVGDRVAITMRNYPEWMFAFKAITSIGAVAVAMNAHWQPDEMAHGLADSGAKV